MGDCIHNLRAILDPLMRSLIIIVGLCTIVRAQTFTTTVDQVVVPLTIHAERNRAADDLSAEDFRVFDDGRPVPIAAFGKVQQSVHVLLLLDTSRSMHASLSDVRSAADAVTAQLIPRDTVRIGTFSSSLHLSAPLSADEHRLIERMPLAPGANITALYDALVEGCGAFNDDMERRAIFVVSDGIDTASVASPREVVERAIASNVAIYAIGGKMMGRPPDSALRDITENTGGRYVYADTERLLATLVGSMIEELHHQYLLAFTPPLADGRLHSLRVTSRRPYVRIQARKQYLAPKTARPH